MPGNQTLQGQHHHNVLVKTANYTVVESSDNGSIFTNEGAVAAITLSLPAATVGQRYGVQVMAAYEVRLDPNGTETIGLPSTGVQGAAGKYLGADAAGEWVELVCVKAGQWECCGYFGTWTAES